MLWEKKPRANPTRDPEPLPPPSLSSEPEAGTPIIETHQLGDPMSENLQRMGAINPVTQTQTTLGRSVVVKGELSGSEDLLIEGQFEGTLNVQDHCVTVGTQGHVKSEIRARQLVIHGTVNGKISAQEKVEIRKTGNVVGDLVSAGISIEDGAYFKGSIEILREAKPEPARVYSVTSAGAKAAAASVA